MRKIKCALSAAAAALVLAAAIPLNVYATQGATAPNPTEGFTYPDTIGGTKTTKFMKALVMDEDANVPNVTFSYTITHSPALAKNASLTDSQLMVKEGVGSPTIGTAVFAVGDTEHHTIVDTALEDSTITRNRTNTKFTEAQLFGTYTLDDTANGIDRKYARKEVTVDFSTVDFDEPGIYRYLITEAETAGAMGITYDVTNSNLRTRYLDVYVEDTGDTSPALSITGYVLQKPDDVVTYTTNASGGNDIAEPATKSQGFINEYETHDITLSKKVTGNQGSRDEYFAFTVNITGATPGTKYNVVLTGAEATTHANGMITSTHDNPDTITTAGATSTDPAPGTATAVFWLRNGQSIKIQGLAAGTNYTITEASTGDLSLDNEGYKTDIVQYTDAALTTEDKTGTTLNYTVTDASRQIASASNDTDKYVAYTNNKNGTVPTGVLLSYTPAAVVGIIVIAGIIFLVRKRRAE